MTLPLLALVLIGCERPATLVDGDADGFVASKDCDDESSLVYPGADELCNGRDDDCDGSTDEEDAVDPATWHLDGDGDGYGGPETTESCSPPPGYTARYDDCDDDSPEIYPGASDTYGDGIDGNCDGWDAGRDGHYEGWELLESGIQQESVGERNCVLTWDLSGVIRPWIDYGCDGCQFMFDVAYTLQEGSTDDGTCLGDGDGSFVGAYGYSTDFNGYGPSWVFESYSAYYWWGYGELIETTFRYWYGFRDYPYSAGYFTYYQYGNVLAEGRSQFDLGW